MLNTENTNHFIIAQDFIVKTKTVAKPFLNLYMIPKVLNVFTDISLPKKSTGADPAGGAPGARPP